MSILKKGAFLLYLCSSLAALEARGSVSGAGRQPARRSGPLQGQRDHELGRLVSPVTRGECAAEADRPIQRVNVLATWGCTTCSFASRFLLQACVFVLRCVRNKTLIGVEAGEATRNGTLCDGLRMKVFY